MYVFFVKFNIGYNICNQISNDKAFLFDIYTVFWSKLLALQNFTLFGIPYIFYHK